MAMYQILFVTCLALCRFGIAALNIDLNSINYEKTERLQRYKRDDACESNTAKVANGYLPLDKNVVEVEFLDTNQTHAARVKWKMPQVRNVPIDGFLIAWAGYVNGRCKMVDNKTLTIDIRSSWRHPGTLYLTIQPIPTKSDMIDDGVMLSFTPGSEDQPVVGNAASTTPSVPSGNGSSAGTGWRSGAGSSAFDEKKAPTADQHEDEYGVELIIGSVFGIILTIILVIILVRGCCGRPPSPPSNKDIYYVSFHAESTRFVQEVKEFVHWLRKNGFNVQMITDENELLNEDNRRLRRELMTFKFHDHMLETADKVFIILSPTYIRLCEMKEDDVKNHNLSEDEKLVYSEIVHIRWELLSNLYRSDRFIPIRFHVSEMADIPFWINELMVFSWPKDKSSDRLLNRLNDLPECPPFKESCNT